MKENPYDNASFFEQYSQMDRSVHGLASAGEWHELQRMLPDFTGRRVLDIGCGFGWHCRWAAEHGAAAVTGCDLSEKMLAQARARTQDPRITYERVAVEDLPYPPESFDIALSSLVLHYVESFGDTCSAVFRLLKPGGHFVLSVEHPVFTARGDQDWHRDGDGLPLHWPVDRYFDEGARTAGFLGEKVTKYHKTLTTYVGGLLSAGFTITGLNEPAPAPHLLDTVPGMGDELRRPMMLLLSARKPSQAEGRGDVRERGRAVPVAVTSDAFLDGGAIPVRHTGLGDDLSPPLRLGSVPDGARSLAVVMDDLDVPLLPAYNHWCIWNLPPEADIPEGIPHGAKLAGGALQGKGYGKHRYRGPKPPFGTHRYRYRVFALDCLLQLSENSDKRALLQAMRGHVLAFGEITGTYTK